MEVKFEIRQRVSTVDQGWLQTVRAGTVEQLARHQFQQLHSEHPAEYFELVQVAQEERCLLFVRHQEGQASRAVQPDEGRSTTKDIDTVLWRDQVDAALRAGGNPTVSGEQALRMLQAAHRARQPSADLVKRVHHCAAGITLSNEMATALAALVCEARRGPALVDATVARHVAERTYGTRYGVDWAYHHDRLGLLSERELEAR